MTKNDYSQELSYAVEAALNAGKYLLKNKSNLNVRIESGPKDTKLQADVESENLIKQSISSISKYPILAEESGKSVENLGDTFWIIDPLDGTANFSRDIPICCVSICLVCNMKPILGVVYDFNNDVIETFVFGRSSSDFSRCYIRLGDKPEVYLVNQNIMFNLQTRPEYWGEKITEEAL